MSEAEEFAKKLIEKRKEREAREEEDAHKTTEELQGEHDRLQDDTLDASRRALKQVMETEEVGIQTAEKLRQQGDQLDHVYKTIKEADTNAMNSRKDAKKVRKYNNICGIHFSNPFNRKYKHTEKAYRQKKEDRENKVTEIQRKPLEDVIMEHELSQMEKPRSKGPAPKNEKDKEITDNLDHIEHVIGNLKVIANDMNEEMDAQEVKLDAIDLVGSHVETTVKEARGKIRKFAY
jgi:hypothetical protein